ncbi:uncharacterized protein LOC121730409 [Aricia agestis]|uniref:uncharacterized protein LOC121730409 n=1 Tax=Aricia agestis TaxID=91739 RepID=UPI001C205B8D|nr:uncharacterized protein LOC121730409 [Aricia agestis]
MNQLIILVVATLLVEGLSAASLNVDSDNEGQAAKNIVKRDASSVFGNGFPFNFPSLFQTAWTDGLKNGNGHYMSTSFVAHTGVDANGKPVTTGVQITDNDGKKTERNF